MQPFAIGQTFSDLAPALPSRFPATTRGRPAPPAASEGSPGFFAVEKALWDFWPFRAGYFSSPTRLNSCFALTHAISPPRNLSSPHLYQKASVWPFPSIAWDSLVIDCGSLPWGRDRTAEHEKAWHMVVMRRLLMWRRSWYHCGEGAAGVSSPSYEPSNISDPGAPAFCPL